MEIDNIKFSVVLNDNNCPIYEENQILLHNINDGTCYFIELTEDIQAMFGLAVNEQSDDENNSQTSQITNSTAGKDCGRGESKTSHTWTRNAVLRLLDLYQVYEPQFTSTTEKNEKVWGRLAKDMQTSNFPKTATQCKDKFKYLKMRYMNKKDNMKDSSSGAACIRFEFFEEMDAFLGKKPNAQPLSIASSSKGNTTAVSEASDALVEDHQDNLPELQPKKKRKINVKEGNRIDRLVNEIRLNGQAREEARDRRHQEMLDMRQRAMDNFSDKMDALLTKM